MKSDDELIKAFKDGSDSAFSELLTRYKTRVYSYVLKMTGNRTASDDLFQEIFLKFAANVNKYRPEQKFSSWIFAVARNLVIDYLRKSKRTAMGSIDEGQEDRPLLETIKSPEKTPEEIALLAEDKTTIEKAFEKLSEEQREVFLMKHYSKLSFREISEIMGLPIGTVLARMSRATARLRKYLPL